MDGKRILVVDNEPPRREHLMRLLRERLIDVLEATTCEEALQLLARERVDLVLTETELPAKSGLYLLKQVKELLPDLEVILTTHNASSYNLLQALRLGAYDFIVRPIDTGEILFSALERAFSHIDLRRQNAALLQELASNNRALERSLAMLQALNLSIERVTAAPDIEELFMELLSSAMRELQVERGFIALFDRNMSRLGIKVSEGIPTEISRLHTRGLPPGLTTTLARRGKPLALSGELPPKLKQLADPVETENLIGSPGLLAAPLRLRERVVGIIVLSGQQNGSPFGEHELGFLIQLSHHAAIALEKAGIIHQLRRGKTLPSLAGSGANG